MKLEKLPSLMLAVALQVLPVCRTACLNPALAPAGFALVFRCLASFGALLGTVNAVSGASVPAGIQGVVPLKNGIPSGAITTNAVGGVGLPFIYRIVVTNGLTDHLQDYFNATPLPPGLTISTNIGSPGIITGTATVASVTFPVTLTAGNTIYDGLGGAPIHLNIRITLTNLSGSGTAPVITAQPQSRTATNGGTAVFSVTATGSPAPGYQWRKNGGNITGATSATYMLTGVTTNDAAGYSVLVSNSTGSVISSNATLTVLVPPAILTQPQSVIASAGDAATFSVTASGVPAPGFQWYQGLAPLPGATAASYTRSGITSNDAGAYHVVVTNSAGSATSANAFLTVAPAQPPLLTNAALTGLTLSFDVVGPSNKSCILWRGSAVGSWTPIQTNTAPTGWWHVSQTVDGREEFRFYRATLGF